MTTAAPSAALAGFLAGYRGLTREAYALDLRQFTTWCRARSLKPFAVRHVSIESFARDLQAKGARPCHRHPAAVHHRRVLQIRGRGGTPGPFPGRARPPPAGGLRVPRRRPGPQRTRRAAGHRARPAGQAWPDLLARAERPAGLRGNRRRHRAPRPEARPSDPDHRRQIRQGRDNPAGTAHGPGDRPGHRRAHRRAGLPGR